jgi:hypothetical protein
VEPSANPIVVDPGADTTLLATNTVLSLGKQLYLFSPELTLVFFLVCVFLADAFLTVFDLNQFTCKRQRFFG